MIRCRSGVEATGIIEGECQKPPEWRVHYGSSHGFYNTVCGEHLAMDLALLPIKYLPVQIVHLETGRRFDIRYFNE